MDVTTRKDKVYTHTHAIMTVAVTGVVCSSFPELSPAVVLAGAVVGSIWPDTPVVTKMVFGKLMYGKHNLSTWSLPWRLWVEISHSIPVIIVAHLMMDKYSHPEDIFSQILSAFILGAFGHIFVDCLTHGGDKFRLTDQSMWWPLYPWLIKVKASQIFWSLEYREDYGVHPMKEFEKVFLAISLIAIPIVWITFI